MCVDLCGVDYLEHFGRWLPEGVEGTRFEVVVNLLSLSKKERVRVRVQAGNDAPESTRCSSSIRTEAMEREAFDLFGILSRTIRI